MNIHFETLNDKELQYLVSMDIGLFLEPIKENPKNYMQFNSALGSKNKKSLLVQKNLPIIATKLFRRQDRCFVKAMEIISERIASIFVEFINDSKEQENSTSNLIDEILGYSNEDVARVVRLYQSQNENEIDFDVLWIQLKLVGIPDVDDRKDDILLLCGVEKEKTRNEEQAQVVGEEKTDNEKKVPPVKKVKHKKLTAEEKAAKTRAANEAKAKSRLLEQNQQENNPNQEKNEITEMGDDKSQTVMSTSNLNKGTAPKDNLEEGRKMSRYIGIINIKTNFYNFTPIGYYEEGNYIPYSENDLDELLPKSNKHNINFFYNFWDDNQVKFMKEKFLDGQLVLLNCEIDELEENRASDGQLNATGYKIQAMEAWNRGKICPLSEMGLYVMLPKEALSDDFAAKRAVRLNYEGLIEGEKILVNLGEGFAAGPFTVKYSSTNDTLFISMQAVDGKHFIYGYKSSDCERVLVEPSLDVENWIGYNSWTYYVIKEDATKIVRDFISDKDLLDSFKISLDKSKELDYGHFDVEKIIDNLDVSQIVGNSIPDEIREKRIERIQQIMSSEEELMQVFAESSDIICELLLRNKDSIQTEKLLTEIITEKPDLLDKMQGVRAIQTKVDSVRAELEQLEAQRTEIQEQIKSIQENVQSSDEKQENVSETITAELAEKKEKLDAVLEQLGVAESAVSLQDKIDKLKEEVSYYDNHKLHLLNDAKNLESNFVELINGYSEKMADITFDGFMSSKMLQAAASWEEKEQNELLNSRVVAINDVQVEEMGESELVDYLVKTIQIPRPGYDRNTIINILTCTAQGFLTVFSGMPGCGKTSICNIISEVLGLTKYDGLSVTLKDISRFIPVSVERGWTSKRDFIGYYNPLTKAFEENNREVFEGLRLLDMEQKKGLHKWPFIILLDEANLSPMEYYWADFMNICDDLDNNSSINLGNNNVFHIPETLHFLATINNDHTTETLSPRLIDRAWVITLPKNSSIQYNREIPKDLIRNITWDEIKKVFTIAGYEKKGFDREIQSLYEALKDKLLRQGVYISPRVDLAIQNYWTVASKLMEEDEYGNTPGLVALDYAVAQKILPKIIGSGEGYEVWLEELRSFCDNKGLTYSAELLTSIINRGNRQMKYYQFFN